MEPVRPTIEPVIFTGVRFIKYLQSGVVDLSNFKFFHRADFVFILADEIIATGAGTKSLAQSTRLGSAKTGPDRKNMSVRIATGSIIWWLSFRTLIRT